MMNKSPHPTAISSIVHSGIFLAVDGLGVRLIKFTDMQSRGLPSNREPFPNELPRTKPMPPTPICRQAGVAPAPSVKGLHQSRTRRRGATPALYLVVSSFHIFSSGWVARPWSFAERNSFNFLAFWRDLFWVSPMLNSARNHSHDISTSQKCRIADSRSMAASRSRSIRRACSKMFFDLSAHTESVSGVGRFCEQIAAAATPPSTLSFLFSISVIRAGLPALECSPHPFFRRFGRISFFAPEAMRLPMSNTHGTMGFCVFMGSSNGIGGGTFSPGSARTTK